MTPLTATIGMGTVLLTTVDVFPVNPSELDDPFLRAAEVAVAFLIVFLIGWLVVEPAISRIIKRRNRNNPTIEEAITRYLRLIIVVCALFVGLTAGGFTNLVGRSGLVIAAATLALGIAGQHVIGSLVSGIALVVDPEFNVGNYIQWEDGEGEVTSITLRITRVQTLDGGLVTIPNTRLTDETIVRPYQRGTCRTVEHVPIAYEDDIETAIGLLTEITEDVDDILREPAPRIGVGELGDETVILYAQYWIDDPIRNRFPVRAAFTRAVKERFERADIEISPATQHDLEGHLRVDNSA